MTRLMKTLAHLGMSLMACALASGAEPAADISPELAHSVQQLTATTCANCHVVSGRSTSPTFPILAAQTAPYLQAQLHALRDQNRADADALTYM
jgi:cytochrome c553